MEVLVYTKRLFSYFYEIIFNRISAWLRLNKEKRQLIIELLNMSLRADVHRANSRDTEYYAYWGTSRPTDLPT